MHRFQPSVNQPLVSTTKSTHVIDAHALDKRDGTVRCDEMHATAVTQHDLKRERPVWVHAQRAGCQVECAFQRAVGGSRCPLRKNKIN